MDTRSPSARLYRLINTSSRSQPKVCHSVPYRLEVPIHIDVYSTPQHNHTRENLPGASAPPLVYLFLGESYCTPMLFEPFIGTLHAALGKRLPGPPSDLPCPFVPVVG